VTAAGSSVGADDEETATATSPSALSAPPLAHTFAPDPNLDPDAPLYTEQDARAALGQFHPIRYDEETEVAPGVHARFVDAGHILGSAIIVVRVEASGGEAERTIVFSGDLGRPGSPILRDYTAVSEADYVLVETTYGGREHEPEAESVRILAETVRLVAQGDSCSYLRLRSAGPRTWCTSSTA
jgi:Cft2 family RNA processing exonuclease